MTKDEYIKQLEITNRYQFSELIHLDKRIDELEMQLNTWTTEELLRYHKDLCKAFVYDEPGSFYVKFQISTDLLRMARTDAMDRFITNCFHNARRNLAHNKFVSSTKIHP